MRISMPLIKIAFEVFLPCMRNCPDSALKMSVDIKLQIFYIGHWYITIKPKNLS